MNPYCEDCGELMENCDCAGTRAEYDRYLGEEWDGQDEDWIRLADPLSHNQDSYVKDYVNKKVGVKAEQIFIDALKCPTCDIVVQVGYVKKNMSMECPCCPQILTDKDIVKRQ